jgi:hypothetical protein
LAWAGAAPATMSKPMPSRAASSLLFMHTSSIHIYG